MGEVPRTMRILIVDDDAEFRRLLAPVLEKRGHAVDVLPSAFGLVNRVAGLASGAPVPAPDVVILDFMLPGLSGASALELLARDPRTARVPVLLLSNLDLEVLESAARAHPHAQAMQKAGRMARVVEAVEELVPSTVASTS